MRTEIVGNTMKFQITSPYKAMESFRDHPHKGIDVNFPNGTELHSVMDGVVEKVVHLKDNIGNGVFVKFEDGTTGIYGHMSKVTVEEGQVVNAGDLLGFSGNSGTTVGTNGGYHLHFGLKDTSSGDFINPTEHADTLIAMSDETTKGIGERMLDGFNDFSDKVISKETEWIFKPLWKGLERGLHDFLEAFTYFLPDMMMIITCIAGLFIMLGFKAPKVFAIYSGTLIAAVGWLANAHS
jgi:hypothetical protein